MKYIIDVPDIWQDSYDKIYKTLQLKFCGKDFGIEATVNGEPYTEPDRQAVEDEVWEFAKKIGSFNGLAKHELDECFGHTTIQGVMTTYDTYQEAKAKYEAWKKEKDEIRVGDEVRDGYGVNHVVVEVDGKVLNTIDENGVADAFHEDIFTKTGRHFDHVERLLEEMKGD